ncbi:MAG: TauD/TfdA family dioxygenase [Acidimicrobiales bacterium]|nr:TauD/TfdA family dioxygenase [Acidimicrobiales bacterium]
MQLEITALEDQPFGALVRGWDPSAALDEAARDDITKALADHVVLVFRGHRQPADEELVAFAESFGPLIKGSEWLRDAGSKPEILPVTNARDDMGIPKGTGGAGELEWHADYSYVPQPAKQSFLNAVELPEAGPRTCFASQYRTLETLPDELVERLRTLRARHSVAEYVEGGKDPNRQQLYKGFEAKRKRDEEAGVQRPPIPEAEHPVVLRHPDTGRELVYVSKGLTREIIGLERSESNALLKQLHQHATRPDAVYAHEWEVGDLVVFDALAGLHRRDSWDPHQQRVMRQLSTMVG